MMMRHLLWKDGMTIKPLVQAILIGIVAIYVVLALTVTWLGSNDSASLYVSVWVLMPNLVALGAPALLVGGEEESGTLSWLRTLPVTWQQVADAKLLAALAAVAVAWAASSVCLLFVWNVLAPNSTGYADSMLSFSGVSYLVFFSLLLLLCGFMTSYLFRSPVVGLIAVVPVIAIASTLSADAGRWLLTGDFRDKGALHSISLADYLSVAMPGLGVLLVAWLAQRGLAFRRLTSPAMNVVNKLVDPPAASAYRPPALVGASRPNPFLALIWQQLRQMGWFAAALTTIMIFLIVNQLAESHRYTFGSKDYDVVADGQVARFLRAIGPGLIATGASWIGGLAFYGDNARRRYHFFADRGISPHGIWLTRVLIPVVCCLVLVTVALSVGVGSVGVGQRSGGIAMAALIVVMVSFGLVVGQWVQRPVMTFLAAPAYASVASIALLIVLSTYASYTWSAMLVAPVLLLASWRLSARWLSGRIDFGYNWRVVAYTVLAVACPIVGVLGARYWTTPALMPQWRAEMRAMNIPAVDDHQFWFGDDHFVIAPDAFPGFGVEGKFAQVSAQEQSELLQSELDNDQIGEHVSLDDVRLLVDGTTPGSDQLKEAGIAVLLKWAGEIRQHVADGEYTLYVLEQVAQTAEVAAVDALHAMALRGSPPELKELVDLIPDRDLRRKSRRRGLISQWKLYDQQPWVHEWADGQTYYGKAFMGHPVGSTVAWIPLERTRCDRFIDKATRFTLEQLDTGLPKSTASPEFQQRGKLWSEAQGLQGYRKDLVIGRYWTAEYENRIEALRQRFAKAD